ncbi:MAG: branched-chain amino acid ABC transporter permease [Chloroflexi bacterium]|nr:branched-chain amino acid ABC transporter permease [Chloroflexota bacterium]
MTDAVSRPADLVGRAQDIRRRYGDTAVTAALWLLIVGLVLWSALNSDTRQLFVNGVVVGSVFALGAIGLTLIYGILKFGNFAHGDLMMLGAYFAFFALTGRVSERPRFDKELPWSLDSLPGAVDRLGDLTFGYGLIIAAVVAVAVMAALSIGLDRLIYRPLRRRGAGIVIFAIASLGVAIAARSLMLIIWGPEPRSYVTGIHKAQQYPFDIRLKTDQIFIFAVAVGLAVLVYLLLYRTKLGKAMRAMSDNPDLARVSGINTDQIIAWTWVIGGALVAVAGVLLAIQAQLNPQLGFVILLPLFASAILGGIGNPIGALTGALVVGIAQEVAVEYFAPGYKSGVAFVILIVILLLRPRGLLGARV